MTELTRRRPLLTMAKARSSLEFPDAVRRTEHMLQRFAAGDETSAQQLELLKKLMVDADCLKLWRSLQKRHKGDGDDFWVSSFISSIHEVHCTTPRYAALSSAERKILLGRLLRLSTELAKLYLDHDLHFSLVTLKGQIFNGLYAFEDFGESNQARIEQAGEPKFALSSLLAFAVERAQRELVESPIRHGVQNAAAISLVRALVRRNQRLYRQPLNADVAIAVNAIHGTNYTAVDVHNLVNRHICKLDGQEPPSCK